MCFVNDLWSVTKLLQIEERCRYKIVMDLVTDKIVVGPIFFGTYISLNLEDIVVLSSEFPDHELRK